MEEKLFDFEVALDRLGGDREFLFELLDEMNNLMDPTLEKLQTAVKNSDYEQLRSVAHGMKGASSNLAVDRMSEYFKKLEDLGVSQSVNGAEDIIIKIKKSHEELLDYLKTI